MLHTLAERERWIALAYPAGWVVVLAVAAIGIWLAARIVWLLIPQPAPAADPGIAPSAQSVSTNGPRGGDLTALHLFGQSPVGLALPAGASAPDTSLDLRLVGTLVGDDDAGTLALIAGADGEALYAPGAEIEGEARLHEVYPDRVILIHQGRYETLRLRDDETGAPPRRRQAPGRDAATAVPGGLTNLERLDWQTAQANLRLDPVQLAQQIRALPIIEDGQTIGVRLQAGRDATLIGKLGLRPTDVITAVNGIPLNDPARAFELIDQLNSQTRFNVDLKRDGREMTLAIDANQLRE